MRKAFIAGMAGLAFTIVAAGDAKPAWPREARRYEPHRLSGEDRKTFIDARVAAIKDGLDLTPEQERHWPRLEQALRDVTEARLDRLDAQEGRGLSNDPLEVMREQADALAEHAGELKKLVSGAEPLYGTLSDAQKHRLFALMRMTPVRLRHRGRRRHWR
jgi:zinc resistance-associated protein